MKYLTRHFVICMVLAFKMTYSNPCQKDMFNLCITSVLLRFANGLIAFSFKCIEMCKCEFLARIYQQSHELHAGEYSQGRKFTETDP